MDIEVRWASDGDMKGAYDYWPTPDDAGTGGWRIEFHEKEPGLWCVRVCSLDPTCDTSGGTTVYEIAAAHAENVTHYQAWLADNVDSIIAGGHVWWSRPAPSPVKLTSDGLAERIAEIYNETDDEDNDETDDENNDDVSDKTSRLGQVDEDIDPC